MKKRPSSSARGYGYQWRKRRARILARKPKCSVCRRRRARAVDHKRPKHRGGKTVKSNLRPICLVCHGKKTRREA